MEQQDAFALGRSNLNVFLFADIGIEGSGMPLSVISALAREGFDPWHEAARLAKLPRATATDVLARLIAAMPASLWAMPDATAIAARLVALLPRQPGLASAAPDAAAGAQVLSTSRWLFAAIAVIVALIGLAIYVAPAANPPTALPAVTKPDVPGSSRD